LGKKLKNRQDRIAVTGLGYVGSVTAAGLAQDNKVIGIGIDKENDRVV
jgi:UDP-N-acetyl-D-mannosaminuronate dehydrogenase